MNLIHSCLKRLVGTSVSVLAVFIGPNHLLPPCRLEHSQILQEANQRDGDGESALGR